MKAKKIGLNAHVLVTLTIQYITEFGIFWVTGNSSFNILKTTPVSYGPESEINDCIVVE